MQNLKSSNQRSGKSLVGLILLAVGCILLLRTLDIFFIPSWVISWPVFMIVIGCFIGSRQGFDRPSAFILIGIGVIFLSNKILPDIDLSRFFWPSMVIALGVWLIFGRKGGKNFENTDVWDKQIGSENNPQAWSAPAPNPAEPSPFDPGQQPPNPNVYAGDKLDSVSVFGGVKKNIVSKNFQGGEIVNFFGGAEINLMQSDITGRVTLEVVQLFGGTKIIVPANWTVQSEMVAIFGSAEDKRPPQLNPASDKVLVIQGTSIFGGIDIKSF